MKTVQDEVPLTWTSDVNIGTDSSVPIVVQIAKAFYYEKKKGSGRFIKHWCSCTHGAVEIPTKEVRTSS